MLNLKDMDRTETRQAPATGSPTGRKPRRQRSPEEIAREKEQIQAFQAGDMAAFEELVKAYEKRIYWVAYNLVGNPEDARDVAQDAFLRVAQAIDRFDLNYSFYTWLYRIVVNLAIDRLRKKGKQNAVSLEDFVSDPTEVELQPERELETVELGDRIQRILEELPEKYRTVILLRDVHELPCEEIAQIIGCTNATTRWRLHKARELFRARWGDLEN
ncbi:MAG: sigma-70 family RNA polymerase sigma factor [Planctomycetes bacterium]|nr:sigma-70 family RNA polymerase sigma factor [Planctomycetota bacterium]